MYTNLKVLNSFLGVERLTIYTDSMYLIQSINSWIYTWLSNGWIKSDGQPLMHKTQYRDLLYAMEDMDVNWVQRLVAI